MSMYSYMPRVFVLSVLHYFLARRKSCHMITPKNLTHVSMLQGIPWQFKFGLSYNTEIVDIIKYAVPVCWIFTCTMTANKFSFDYFLPQMFDLKIGQIWFVNKHLWSLQHRGVKSMVTNSVHAKKQEKAHSSVFFYLNYLKPDKVLTWF